MDTVTFQTGLSSKYGHKAKGPKGKGRKAVFGKFVPGRELPLRSYETAFGITARDGPDSWKSSSVAVQRLLDHLLRFSGCVSSREIYLRNLLRLCKATGREPDELIVLAKNELEFTLQGCINRIHREGSSKTYLNSLIKRMKTFLRANGRKDVEIQTFHIPARYRKTPEHIPSKEEIYRIADATGNIRDRALILCLWSSGLRVSTLCALDYSDIQEALEGGQELILTLVYPEMKERVPAACKGNIPYHTFFAPEAFEVLCTCLRERVKRYGGIEADEPLFSSRWNQVARQDRSRHRITRMTISKLLRAAARHAGIEQGEDIHPHSLRKAFESVLRSPCLDGSHMDYATQQFLFGHILPGAQAVYYDKTSTEFHRQEYAKLNFGRESGGIKGADLLMMTLRASAALGQDPERIVNEYVLAKHGQPLAWREWDMERQARLMNEAREWRKAQVGDSDEVALVSQKDRVVDIAKLDAYLARGWTFVSTMGTTKCVIRKVNL